MINQGNWGDRKQFLDFGYGDANGRANPHDNINGTETVLTLDGVNKRVGIGTTSPSAKLEVNGLVAAKILKVGGGVEVDMFDDGASVEPQFCHSHRKGRKSVCGCPNRPA